MRNQALKDGRFPSDWGYDGELLQGGSSQEGDVLRLEVKKKLVPVVEHLKSPISMRSIAAFILTGFLIYTSIDAYYQRQAQRETDIEIGQLREDAKLAFKVDVQQQLDFDKVIETQKGILDSLVVITQSMKETSTIFNKTVTRREQARAPTLLKKPKLKRKTASATCYELQSKVTKVGNNLIVAEEYVQVKCKK